MLRKINLRALSPGQWARVRVPDSESWQKCDEGNAWYNPEPGQEVDICIVPHFVPRFESAGNFEWRTRVIYRRPGSRNATEIRHGWYITPADFGLIDTHYGLGPNWDKQTMNEHYEGKGKFLYQPASDDAAICPGGDWSRFECDKCGKFVIPFSDDQGNLICGTCEATGLVILDEEVLNKLEDVREFARSVGLSSQLEGQLHWLGRYGSDSDEPAPGRQCTLWGDFAPHSFAFSHWRLPDEERRDRTHIFHGGLIYQGPTSPANGGFPSLCVSLAEGNGWFCHT
jgi:hypothetical protein